MTPTLIAPPYTGPHPTCSQCGHIGASTTHEALAGLGSVLRRACSACGYPWTERPGCRPAPPLTFGLNANHRSEN